MIRRVEDPSARAGLGQELSAIRAGQHRREFHVVVFGTGSAGKTSLVSALLGRDAGKSEAVMGTTQRAENHTYSRRRSRGKPVPHRHARALRDRRSGILRESGKHATWLRGPTC